MNLPKISILTSIALLTFVSSSITPSIFSGQTVQVLAQTQDDRKAEAARLYQQALEQYQTSQFQASLGSLQQALEIYQDIGDRVGEGLIFTNLGFIYAILDQYPQALEYFQQALPIAQEIGDREGEGQILNGLGSIYAALSRYPQALEYHQQSLFIRQEIGDYWGEGASLNAIGEVYRYLGQYSQALKYYQQALSVAQEVKDRAGEGTILNNMGLAYNDLGQYSQALKYYQQALSIAQEVNNQIIEGTILGNIGLAYNYLGQYSQALEYLRRSLVINQETGNRADEGTNLSSIGGVYLYLGQYLQALEYSQQALSIAQEIGNRTVERRSLGSIGMVYYKLEQYSQALEYLQRSLALSQEVGDRTGEGLMLNNIGQVYFFLEQYPQASEYFQRSLVITQETGNRTIEATTLSNLGRIYLYLEQYPQALEYFQRSLTFVRDADDRAGESIILSNIGATFFKLGQFQNAETELSNATAVLDTLHQQDLTDADKISLFDTQFNVYQVLQQVQIAQNKIELALETSERGRGRAFVSLLSQVLQQEADSTPNRLTPSISNIQQTAREQNATLVQYSVINTSVGTPALYIWVIAPTGEIAFRSVELNEENQQALSGAINTAFAGSPVFRGGSTTISNLVSNVHPTNRSVNRDIEFEYNPNLARNSLRQLHQLLIEPIADLLPRNPTDRIVFIPQGGLFLVPFVALQDDNGDYLIQHHTISIAPSIQVLDLTQQQQPDRSLDNALVVGNPSMPTIWDAQSNTNIPLSPLPGSEQEATAIAQLLHTTAITGRAATETAITQQMSTASIIHLATHGLLEYGNPADSGVVDVPGAIALTRSNQDDGLLTSAEILEMQLQAELVVLSACDTGRGRITGDGVVGLSRAFISAGVPSVVVSLWSVPDAPTAELMTEFYRQLENQPDKAQALRQAMLITMQQHPDPIDWAAFTLIGEAQ